LRLAVTLSGVVMIVDGIYLQPAFALLALGELIDRLEFYDELEVPTPESLMQDDLARNENVSDVR
jgi:hypothetical protein